MKILPEHDIYDNWELFKPLIISALIVSITFYIVELYIPSVVKKSQYYKKCESRGGFVYNEKNKEIMCINKDYLIINL